MESARNFLHQWYGILTTAAVAVSALWLVYSGKHTLFVHPRYTIFITEMALIALIASIWALWNGTTPTHHTEDNTPTPTTTTWTNATTTLLVTTALIMVLLIPPAPLSTNLAGARANTQATPTNTSNIIRTLADLPPQPTTADWARLLMSQTRDDLNGQHAHIDGFVTTDDDIANQGYYIVRFSIICCAVDAFPARIPIYDPQWRDHVEIGQWLDIEGNFHPSNLNILEEWILHPTRVTPINEPEQPYLF